MTTLLEGCLLALCALPVACFCGWLFRDDPPPEPPKPESQWRCVMTQRAGHVFVVVYHDNNIGAAIEALCNLAVSSRTPMHLGDADKLADTMRWRAGL